MRKATKKTTALEEAAEDQAALEEIAKIRRNGFNPGEELVNRLILTSGPKRAFIIMRASAAAYRKIVPYH
ncbi:MAG: hypothetical protein EPN22_17360 [Nitrospirae bacterium]|nr:MAG: hypothetical protein EPN22_17360 [Nitrospirota bacterium]